MTAPRMEIDLSKITANTRFLVRRLAKRGISVTGVTKAVCGHPDIARAMLEGGAIGLADARVSNVKRMREAGIACPLSMIRAPMQCDIEQVVRHCDASYNTELDTILSLAAAARQLGRVHNVILMVEMGDLRDGILPENVENVASRVAETPGVALKGLGANFACMGDVAPTADDMKMLSRMANNVEGVCGPYLELVSGGSSANLRWALGHTTTGRINNLRLGEAILLGIEPVSRQPIEGLHVDAVTLFAEVIETQSKPRSRPVIPVAPALGTPRLVEEDHSTTRSILAIGQQDTDTSGLRFPTGTTYLGATSDHTVIDTGKSSLPVGNEIQLDVNYSALMRAMTTSDVAKVLLQKYIVPETIRNGAKRPRLVLV